MADRTVGASMELATEFATIVRWIEEDICRAVLVGMFVCCTYLRK